MTVGTLFMLAAGLMAAVFSIRRRDERGPRWSKWGVVIAVSAGLSLLGVVYALIAWVSNPFGEAVLTADDVVVSDLAPRVSSAAGWLTNLGLVVGFLGIVALFGLAVPARADWTGLDISERQMWLGRLRGAARQVLVGLSAAIIAGVFATGALGIALAATFGDAFQPASGTAILFGGLLSGMLALAYLPTEAAISRQADTLVNEIVGVPLKAHPDGDLASLKLQLETRNLVAESLGAGGRGRQTLQETLVIAGPLLSSIVALLIT